ncbi:uncharacterized protein LOC111072332 [Drosophila obscura]|uniref:uncharacterized protein LOC111072332 n=1 Tax=Drosophila obscura TaxID=7282 RepID=UPI001BB237FE|nr:uncharacterized protein LOC111072332 [Drosophila obscura]
MEIIQLKATPIREEVNAKSASTSKNSTSRLEALPRSNGSFQCVFEPEEGNSMRCQLSILLIGLAVAAAFRLRRQVIAPTWLRDPVRQTALQVSKVVVTPQNLRETAAIRTTIQKAVQEDTYVVAARPPLELRTSLGSGSIWPMPVSFSPTPFFQPWNLTLPNLGAFNLWPEMG